jgi:Acetyltransferases
MPAGSRKRRRRKQMLRLRPPRADEGPKLTELCLRSKASHGYDEAFMAACREELTVDPGGGGLIAVAELNGECAGVAEMSLEGEKAELCKLFVDPLHQGKGVGRALFDWAREEAAERGARVLALDADPGAAAFYEKMDARMVGQSPSGSIPGRVLPRFELPLAATASA